MAESVVGVRRHAKKLFDNILLSCLIKLPKAMLSLLKHPSPTGAAYAQEICQKLDRVYRGELRVGSVSAWLWRTVQEKTFLLSRLFLPQRYTCGFLFAVRRRLSFDVC